ncbi:hypothetical protein LguiA_009643 [Lonicera macranthoides]
MASSSKNPVEGNSSMDVDIRFMLKQCKCGEIADVKITKSNKNNNRGRIYYSCKRQRCGNFLGWCKVSSFGEAANVIVPQEECSTSWNLVVGKLNTKWKILSWRDILIIISFFISVFLAIKGMM